MLHALIFLALLQVSDVGGAGPPAVPAASAPAAQQPAPAAPATGAQTPTAPGSAPGAEEAPAAEDHPSSTARSASVRCRREVTTGSRFADRACRERVREERAARRQENAD